MRRVVITGIGVVSCLGNNREEVLGALRNGRSGIRFIEEFQKMGLRSHIAGNILLDIEKAIDRKIRRFMGDAAAYTYVAMKEAIDHAGLTDEQISNPRVGLIAGSGGGSAKNVVATGDLLRSKGVKRVGPYMVPRTMCSTVSACLATPFKIKGVNYSITSACATSIHCIGNAMEHIQEGRQDMMFAGGGEEVHWSSAVMFDAMGALSSKYNDTPETASRPYDVTRDGFVIAGGGGILVLEELDHAKRRGATILAELVGYAATSDGYDMVSPSGEGAVRCMHLATDGLAGPIDYVNTHGTSTPAGDVTELRAIKEAFGDVIPRISSTKSLTGHSLGAAGVQEAIYCLLMLEHDFIAASVNLNEMDPEAEGVPIVRECVEGAGLNTVLSNSFGFGGTNGCLVIRRYSE